MLNNIKHLKSGTNEGKILEEDTIEKHLALFPSLPSKSKLALSIKVTYKKKS